MRIWKWSLDLVHRQAVNLPAGSTVLTVQLQDGVPQLWALCDETLPATDEREILIYGTGQQVPDPTGQYIGTFQIENIRFVGHVFEERSPAPSR